MKFGELVFVILLILSAFMGLTGNSDHAFCEDGRFGQPVNCR